MAKKYNKKWWVIGIIVAFLVITSYDGDGDKKTGFGCTSNVPANYIEPNNIMNYDLGELTSTMQKVDVASLNEDLDAWSGLIAMWTEDSDFYLGMPCFYNDGAFYDGQYVACLVGWFNGLGIHDMYLWSEGQYNTCSDFFANDPHAYMLGYDVPCYMQPVNWYGFQIFKDYALRDGECTHIPVSEIPISPDSYYACSDNDLFLLAASDIRLLTAYKSDYTAGSKEASRTYAAGSSTSYVGSVDGKKMNSLIMGTS